MDDTREERWMDDSDGPTGAGWQFTSSEWWMRRTARKQMNRPIRRNAR